MRLLLTNDDGIYAPGLRALAEQLGKYHEVIIAAPDNQRSASGHSITISRPVIVKEVILEGLNMRAFSLDGTPADCTRIGVGRLVQGKIDMVVSGINRGLNLGTDVLYSGTVSAAVEAAINKIPSMAVSMDIRGEEEPEYSLAAEYAVEILKKASENHIGDEVVLNVNVPFLLKKGIKGIKVCPIGTRLYDNTYVETITAEMHSSLEIRGHVIDTDNEETDTFYQKQGYITVTPLHYDLTNFSLINKVSSWFR